MKTQKHVIIVIVEILFLFMLASPLLAQERQLKIGLLAPLSGPNPDWGKKQVIGLEMALEKINRRGGVMGTPLKMVVRDTGGNAKLTPKAYRDLAGSKGVLAVIGPLFTEAFIPVAPITNEMKVAIIATASAKPGLSDLSQRPYAFRMTVTSDKKEAPAAKAWVSAYRIKKVVIVYVSDTKVWVTVAEALWPRIMAESNVEILNKNDPLSFLTGQSDFAALVRKIAAYNPDGICIAAFPIEAGKLIKEIRHQKLPQPILGASGTSNPKLIEFAGAAAEGLWSTSLFFPEDPNPKVRTYIKEFKKRCAKQYPDMNCDPEQYDLLVYDLLQLLADIMKKNRITGMPQHLEEERNKIKDGLANMKVWRGTAGMMSFDSKGDGIRTIHIVKVINGKWQKTF